MDNAEFSKEQVTDLARWLKVLAEPNRLLLLEQIIEGVQCNCELGNALQLAPNLISHHLSVLREVGLVNVERDPKDARWVYYSINLKAFEDFRQTFNTFFDPDRIQSRRVICGPQAFENLRFGIEKRTD
ncbi:MAG: metalloregulator ArsR/SmtB family transcription factor [Bellilinea sp.]|jgi:ArsR family transcriptional regulator